MRTTFKLFPRPLQSLILLVVWLLLNNSLSAGHIVLGSVLAILIPLLTRPMMEDHPVLKRPLLACKYALVLLKDIILCNIEVTAQVLGPMAKLSPGFVAIPLDITGEFPITLLASTISLTPGTVSADVSEDRRWLYVHALHLTDEQALITAIKQNYEAPLKEIFAC
jgi:multicomponent K+:H+ antiporter subunit E